MGELFNFADTSWLTSSDGQHKLLFDLTANNTHLDLLEANTIRCLTGAPLTERLRIAADGKVGIGTSSPDRPLTVHGSGGTYLNVKANGGTYEVLLGADAAGGIVSTMTNHDLQLRAGGNSTKVTLKANGNVGIGTGDPGYRLDVSERMRVRQGGTPSAGIWFYQSALSVDRAFVGMANDDQVGLWGNAGAGWGLVMNVANGRVGIGTGNPTQRLDVAGAAHASSFPTSSDVRFKTNITPLSGTLAKLAQVQGVAFDWNDAYTALGRATGRREIGVLAHEVEAVFPELVSTWGEQAYKAVDYGRLTGVLIEAIKELHADVERLKMEVQARG